MEEAGTVARELELLVARALLEVPWRDRAGVLGGVTIQNPSPGRPARPTSGA